MHHLKTTRQIVWYLCLCFTLILAPCAASVKEGFEALSVYDYFKAKKIFYQELKKKDKAYAAYGLAVIFSRSDNPFHHSDSASKYIHISYNTFKERRAAANFFTFSIDSARIAVLCDSIAQRSLRKVRNTPSVASFDRFLSLNYLASSFILKQAVYLRDELEFDQVLRVNRSDSTLLFMRTHPQSRFYEEARLLLDREIFDENTAGGTAEQYIAFIQRHPSSVMLQSAFDMLYHIYKQRSDAEGLKFFVSAYPRAPQTTDAWKLLFSLKVKSFSVPELEKFLKEFPAFPFKNSILAELELSRLNLFPYAENDLFGFVDSTGRKAIPPQYESITPFSEGLSVVSRNDSVWYVNKQNANPFSQYYTEAYPFKNGMAAVKQQGKWFFINRQGQSAGAVYEEISELSDEVWVIRQNGKYGAVDHYGQRLFEPRFDKLGDFRNGFAYYVENGRYGFVSKSGYVHKAQYEWISDFDESRLAIIRQNNLYGLVNARGEIILNAAYDQVLRAARRVFIVVKNGQYGFYSGEQCFFTQLAFDFMKEKPADYYSDGVWLKLLKKQEQTLADKNGRLLAEFGAFEELHFPRDGWFRVKRKGKFCYADRKMSLSIPCRYQQASDFFDSCAIVQVKEKTALLSVGGKEVFATGGSLEKLSPHYYLVEDEQKDIVNQKGEKIFMNVKEVQKADPHTLLVTLSTGEVRLLRD